MLASYHNHTAWSDGKGTVADMIEGAIELGLAELGFSDHYVLHPSGAQPGWSLTHEQLSHYVAEIRELGTAARARGLTVRLGLEVDWFPGQAGAIRAALEAHPFDFLLGSVHEIDGFTIDSSSAPWARLDADGIDALHRRYWITMRSLAESGLFDIVAHIDLPKKFGFHPTRQPQEEIDAALDAIAATGSVVELNTAGWHKPCADAYPTLDILMACRARGIPVTLSADAHTPDHLLRDFDLGAERLAAAGYAEVARFAGRSRSFCSLESARIRDADRSDSAAP